MDDPVRFSCRATVSFFLIFFFPLWILKIEDAFEIKEKKEKRNKNISGFCGEFNQRLEIDTLQRYDIFSIRRSHSWKWECNRPETI